MAKETNELGSSQIKMVTLVEAKRATDTIVETVKPFSVAIFGSVAKWGTGTDLDLLVILDEGSDINGNSSFLLPKCLKKFSREFAIDPFVIPLSLFNRYYFGGSPFLRLIAKEGRALYMKNAVNEWMKQAEEEFGMAEYLFHGGYFKGACYHAQQAVEKSIKARLFKKGWELEKTHKDWGSGLVSCRNSW